MSTLGAQTISHLSLAIPKSGSWRADVTLSSGEAPTGATTLVVADLELEGTVLRSGLDAPGKPHAVVVGGIGWGRELARPLSYRADLGVRLSTVLRDLAKLAGETIEQPTDRALEEHFAACASSPGAVVLLRDVLEGLRCSGYLASWRVDPDGVTRFGDRVGTDVTARATRLRSNQGAGMTVYGIDAPRGFLPGNVLDGFTISRLVVRETAGKLEVTVW